MVDWQMLEGIGGIATAAAVIFALAFGLAQVRQFAVQRREAAWAEIARTILTPDFVAALDTVMNIPDEVTPQMISSEPNLRRAILFVDYSFEGVGIMVFERTVPLHTVDRGMGGVVRAGWARVRGFMEAERLRQQSPTPGEWWQWLAERMEEDPAPGKRAGAHVAFKTWRRG